MNADLAALKSTIEGYVADVEAYRASVKDAVAKAVAAHDAECSADIKTLQDEVAAADAKLNPPVFTPSGNG